MNKGKIQGIGLCLVIGMLFNGSNNTYAQDIAKAHPSHTYASYHKEVKALNIGDQVPDIQFENVINYKSKTAKLSDFKGKLIILDMWSTWCTSCIAAFPKMELLQKKFKDKIQILLVNPHDAKFDSEDKIKSVLQRQKKRTGFYPTLPIPIGDSILNVLFPHQTVPHIVLIDPNLNVMAITESNEITTDNIQTILDGNQISIKEKKDELVDYDFTNHTLSEFLYETKANIKIPTIYSSTLIKGYNKNLKAQNGVRWIVNDSKDQVYTGHYLINHTLFQIYQSVYPNLQKYHSNRIFIEISNFQKKQEFTHDTSFYSLDAVLPATTFKKMLECTQGELEKIFHTTVKIEKRKIKCLVLKSNVGIHKFLTKGGERYMSIDDENLNKYISNYSVDNLINEFNHNLNKPLINETAINYSIDIRLSYDFSLKNKISIIKTLKRLGFSIIEEEKEIEVAVIMDK